MIVVPKIFDENQENALFSKHNFVKFSHLDNYYTVVLFKRCCYITIFHYDKVTRTLLRTEILDEVFRHDGNSWILIQHN